jgi:beta-lactamase regulating signal transducer with metallopeptidase domain
MMMMLFLSTCLFTFIGELNQYPQNAAAALSHTAFFNASGLLSINTFNINHVFVLFSNYFSANAPLVVLIWFLCFITKTFKLAGGWLYAQRIKKFRIYTPPPAWIQKFDTLCLQLKINKAVKLMESGYVKVPVVIGYLKPVVLIPVGLLTGLPAEQIEAVLLHELAHICRKDYLVNLLQCVAETVFFFNPALLWMSSALKEERENCCDDIALELMPDKTVFVRALISFKEHATPQNYAMAFPGNRNQLLQRVTRILNNDHKKAFGITERVFVIASALLLATIISIATVIGAKTKGATHIPAGTTFIKSQQSISTQKGRMIVAPLKTSGTRLFVSFAHPGKKTYRKAVESEGKESSASYYADATNTKKNDEQNSRLIDKQKAELSRQQSILDQKQAFKDQLQAQVDLRKAKHDQELAQFAQAKAKLDEQLAQSDQKLALDDQLKAKLDQERAYKEQAAENHARLLSLDLKKLKMQKEQEQQLNGIK